MSTDGYFNELESRKRLGRNIRALRKFYGFSQAEFARLVRVKGNRHWLQRIESGKSRLDAVDLPAIARVLRCTPEELVNYDLTQ